MNIHFLMRRLRGKPTLVKGGLSSLASTARILNASDCDKNILVGRHCRIEGELFVFGHGGKINIGDWCFIGPGTRIWSASHVFIGDRVLISHNVNVMDSLTHPINASARHQQFREISNVGHPKKINLNENPVRIENDAWIGAGATILKGVTVGEAAIVGAGSVVTKNVAPRTVVAGNPAKLIRTLTREECSPQ